MSESRVRENRMPGLTGGRWRSGSHGEPERCARRETGGTEPDHLPRADPPAAYLTAFAVVRGVMGHRACLSRSRVPRRQRPSAGIRHAGRRRPSYRAARPERCRIGVVNLGVERRRPLAVGLVAAIVGIAFADSSIVVLALPQLYGRFHASIQGVAWVLTAYNIAVAVCALGLVLFVHRLRGKLVLAAGLVLFLGASIACSAAGSLAFLIGARCVQGAGAALLLAGALPVLVTLTGSPAAAATIWTLAGTLGAALGPALGGVLTEAFDALPRGPARHHRLGIFADRRRGDRERPPRRDARRPPTAASAAAAPRRLRRRRAARDRARRARADPVLLRR